MSTKEASKRFLVVITDDEWDMTDLILCSEITTKRPLDADAKKREIVNFAKDSFHYNGYHVGKAENVTTEGALSASLKSSHCLV